MKLNDSGNGESFNQKFAFNGHYYYEIIQEKGFVIKSMTKNFHHISEDNCCSLYFYAFTEDDCAVVNHSPLFTQIGKTHL